MGKCDICGRETNRIHKMQGFTLCSKHMHQLYKYGEFKDTCPRTQNDLNEYWTEGEVTKGGLYDGKTSEQIDEFIIDTEDLPKIQYHKWRFSHSHIVTGLPAKGTQRELSWVILNLDNRDEKNKDIVIDHINGDPRDNRKQNLRICYQSQNVLNKKFMSNNTSGFIGVSYIKDRDRYDPEIRKNSIRCHLGYTSSLQEAVYKRYYAEQLIFKDFMNPTESQKKKEFTETLPLEVKQALEQTVRQKLKDKGLWQ